MMDAKNLSGVRDISHLDQMTPYLAAELDRMENTLIIQTMMAMTNGSLTPDKAYQAWAELAAVRKLGQRFGQTKTALIESAKQHAKALDIRK